MNMLYIAFMPRKKAIPPKEKKKENHDPRYQLIGPAVREGKINSFSQLFICIPPTKMASDLGMKVGRLNEIIDANFDDFTVARIRKLALLAELPETKILELILGKG